METEATYNDGRLELPAHIRLKHQRFKLRVQIPDAEIDPGDGDAAASNAPQTVPETVAAYAENLEARLSRIRNATPPDEAVPAFTDKQQERMDAFAVRDQQQERG